MQWKKYKKGCGYSYTLGPYPTFELIRLAGDRVMEVVFSPDFTQKDKLIQLLEQKQIPWRENERLLRRLESKGNAYVIGIFKTDEEAEKERARDWQKVPHLVLDQVSDMGNLGSIMRTAIAMGVDHLVTVGPSCDINHPKSVRASMGAYFRIHHLHLDHLTHYHALFGGTHALYLFMLEEGACPLPFLSIPGQAGSTQEAEDVQEGPFTWSLVFGNEGSGLDPAMAKLGQSVIIPQSPHVDSLNLTTACAIALYAFHGAHLMDPGEASLHAIMNGKRAKRAEEMAPKGGADGNEDQSSDI